MAGTGGARPGTGPKKGSHRIAASDLRKALEAELGIPYVKMLAETQLKLFNDFKVDKNVKEYVRFTENMSARLLETQEVSQPAAATVMSTEDLLNRAQNIATILALTQPQASKVD